MAEADPGRVSGAVTDQSMSNLQPRLENWWLLSCLTDVEVSYYSMQTGDPSLWPEMGSWQSPEPTSVVNR